MGELSGKVAVITGGGGVLCSTIAEGLAREGVRAALLDLAEDKAKAALQKVREAGSDGLAIKTDVLSRADLEAALKQVLDTLGRVDFLINGAGGNHPRATTSQETSLFELPEEAVRFVFDLNFLGTFLTCQVFGKELATRGEGVILNIASMAALRPLTRIPAYAAAKAAVANFTQWLAVHMAQEYSPKIRVVAIAPGFFLTEQNRFLLMDEEGNLTQRGKQILDHTPMGRFGDPRDLIGPVRWLLSKEAAFVTGAVIPIDGGFSAYAGV
ncbi:MAG TPA: SDR family oxidoreductase [Candidatus Acetothermia bacterium]|nr:SDR family oxidoreductase [Candidatus Acetothermia bacterium]